MAAGFFIDQSVEMIESCLRQAVMRFGKPDILYLDNGKIYRSEWLKKACTRLGIRIVHTKPYSPEAHGKIEAFNRRVDSFLSEAALKKCGSLDELNHYLELWIDEYCFDKKPTQRIHFRKVENAVAYLDEYLAQHAPHKEFRFWNRTGLED